MKKFYLFVKYGYEDEETVELDTEKQVTDWLVDNEESDYPARVDSIVHGQLVNFTIERKATSATLRF